MTTSPGFSSRSTDHTFQQFPQRDEAQMSDEQMGPGFSNSEAADHAPDDVHPEMAEPESLDPGFSNDKAVTSDTPATEAKVISEDSTEDKAVAKKAAAKKSASKTTKKG